MIYLGFQAQERQVNLLSGEDAGRCPSKPAFAMRAMARAFVTVSLGKRARATVVPDLRQQLGQGIVHRYNADQPLGIVENRNSQQVVFSHDPRSLFGAVLGTDCRRIVIHDLCQRCGRVGDDQVA